MRSWRGYASLFAFAAVIGAGSSCITVGPGISGTQTFKVTITQVNGKDPPTADAPLPANIGDHAEVWHVDVEARDAEGNPVPSFNGYVRLSVRPGAVVSVVDTTTNTDEGRNLLLQNGEGHADVAVTAVYGPSRIWVEDLGYVPAPPGKVPACSNGKNDDPEEDVLVDYPNDPGCAYADDDTETGGTFDAGTSNPVNYYLPTIRQIQGVGSTTPFPYEAIQAKTDDPQYLVVTRISKDGFYVTDLNDQGNGYNHLFAFNFSTPAGMQICDRVTYLSGTLSEFFGFTELNFPSYRLDPLYVGQEDQCKVPEPALLDTATIGTDAEMEKLESGLVRIEGYTVPKHFGPGLVVNNAPADGASNCDLNGDGTVDFASEAEGGCSSACDSDPECSEWTSYLARGNYKVHDAMGAIQINTDSVTDFNPVVNPGVELTAVTGTLRNFSGGNFNWTIEARCTDDLVCGVDGCAPQVLDSKHACVHIVRTTDDNDEGSN